MRPTNPLPVILLTVGAVAQQPDPTPAGDFFDTILVPIHASSSDSMVAEHGLWAAGPDYKVRLDGGFEYLPVLGSAYPENLPFGWSTESVAIGDTELVTDDRAEVRAGDYRYEYHLGAVTEAYDIRLDGVEQTFLVARAPIGRGELVVTGRVTTSLRAEEQAATNERLVFRGASGERILDYGVATAVDARGREFPMTTSFDGERIRLRLDAASVAAARFPLLLDPLINNDGNRECGMTSVATLEQQIGGTPTGMSCYTRINSATDHDAIAVLTESGFVPRALAWADLSTQSSERIAVAALDAPRRLVIVAERQADFRTHLELYSHDPVNLGFRAGVSTVLTSPLGQHFRNPDVGGATTGQVAFVVYDLTFNPTGSTTHRIRGLRFDGVTGSVSFMSSSIAGQSATNHRRAPSITPSGPSWIVVWAESELGSGTILGRRIHADGTQDAIEQILQPATGNLYRNVRIAGLDGSYLLTWQRSPLGLGTLAVRARRLDWPSGAPSPTGRPTRFLHGGGSGYTNGEVAYDSTTKSHWLATYVRGQGLFGSVIGAARVEFGGAVIETTDVHGTAGDQPFAPSVAFNRRLVRNAFGILYATRTTPSNSVLGELYQYPAACYAHIPYGAGCGSFDRESFDPTITGSRHFTLTLPQNFGGLSACFISPLSAALPLDVINMIGCTILVEPALSVVVPGTLNGGSFEISFSLPATFTGLFNTQWFYVEPGANPADFVCNAARTHEAR